MAELQTRVFCGVQGGIAKLPPRDVMSEEIAKIKRFSEERYKASGQYQIRLDYVDYFDELAAMIGAVPSVKELLWKDFVRMSFLLMKNFRRWRGRSTSGLAFPISTD